MLYAAPSAAKNAKTFTLKAGGEKTIETVDTSEGMVFKGYEGKPVLLNFFGKHCRYCMREIPHLVALQKKYGNKIAVIGVHVQQRMTQGERFMLQNRLGFNYPIYEYMDNVPFVRHVGARAGWQGGIPFSILFDGKGRVVDIFPGYVDERTLDGMIQQALHG